MPRRNKPHLFGRHIGIINFILLIIDLIIMIIPTIGYLDTLRIMIKNKNPDVFPEQIIIILLIAHSMKIMYFIYHHYAIRIFGQSVSQIIVALLLAYTKFYYLNINSNKPKRRRSSAHGDKDHPQSFFSTYCRIPAPKDFFKFLIYILFHIFGIFAVFRLFYHCFSHKFMVNILSYLANFIESGISIPIFVRVVIRKDVNNVSTLLILQYISGDILKLGLFLLNHTPISFIVGSILQLALDVTICIYFVHLRIKLHKKSDDAMLIPKERSYADNESSLTETEDEKPILTTEKFEAE